MVNNDDSVDVTLKNKYKRTRVRYSGGVSRYVAERIARFVFKNKIISVHVNRDSKKFTLLLSRKTSDVLYRSFVQEWNDVFEVYRAD